MIQPPEWGTSGPSTVRGWGALFFVAAALIAPPALQGAPPLRNEFRPNGPTCFLNRNAATLNAARLSGAGLMGAPTPPSPRVLVIRVDFSDLPMAAAAADTDAFFLRVRDFYLENSYGVFQPTFTVTSAVHRLGSLATYGADCGGDVACRDVSLRAAAVTAENAAGRDFSAFDHVMIYHAGAGQETSGSGNDIWSVFFPGGFVVDGKTFEGFTVVPEREAGTIDPLGVIAHEYGHQIGLPDLYDTSVNGGASTVGAWDIMDYPYTGSPQGSNPPHLGAWSKSFLGFVAPSTWTGVGTATLYAANVAPSITKVPLQTAEDPATEYLLLEYRRAASTSTFDKSLPGSGLLVWHIDDAIAAHPLRLAGNDVNTPSSSGQGHRGIDLIEADFSEFYAAGQRSGQAGDAFDTGRSLLPPHSDAHNGVASGVAITSVAGVGGETVQVFIEPPTASTFAFSGGASPLSVVTPAGRLDLVLPAGALPNGTVVFAASYTATTLMSLGSGSAVASLEPTGIGFVLSAQRNLPPAGDITATFSYAGLPPLASLSGEEASRLIFARYVSDRGLWVPVPTEVDPGAQTLSARFDRLSVIQVMTASPGSAPAEVRIFPNPLRPSLGSSYRSMNFTNLPPDARLRVFTAAGEIIRELRANNAGHAVWDGRNGDGHDAASGLYLVLVEDPAGGRRKVKKVAIER